MSKAKDFLIFANKAMNDPRIGPRHISLYLALLIQWHDQGRQGVITYKTDEMMRSGKIGGRVMFYSCIRQLHEFGYVNYQPSFDRKGRSKVIMSLYDVGKNSEKTSASS